MSERNRHTPAAAGPRSDRAPRSLPDHPVRIALLDLLAETGTLTSSEAAARLGHSSGLCSFHLRQLARHGLVEEAPRQGGRARPWQLRWGSPEQPGELVHPDRTGPGGRLEEPDTRPDVARASEGGGPRRRAARPDRTPAAWQQDESFSAVLHLTSAEAAELTASIRRLVADYRDRDRRTDRRPRDAVAVAAVTRLLPLPGGEPATTSTGTAVD
ncbi:winged helix-turn-helix domain-containing protein [Streptomyces sp. URMC 126]|uniref:winged helix-turn-helix domain-containing protein n=1 Tax=Streptomyces sp. URMC 126 TaxID=3423401 RepID=UPI003F1D9035